MTRRPPQTALAPISKASPALRTPANVYLEGLAETSKPAMRGCLKRIARIVNPEAMTSYLELPWHTLRFEEVRILRRKIIETYPKPGYANVHIAALRGVLKTSWKMGLFEDFHRVQEELKLVNGRPLHSGRELKKGEVEALFAVADPRDAALLAVLRGAGLRRVEASRLLRKDYDGTYIKAFGKRNKERRVPLLPSDRPRLDAWCETLPDDPNGPLLPRLRNGKLTREKLTVSAMNRILDGLQKRAGVKKFSPHDLRRHFATQLFEAGVDISIIQGLCGHSSPAVTVIYDLRSEKAKDAAMLKLDEFLRGKA